MDKFEQKAKNRLALLAALYSASILMFFVVMGELILKALSIPLPAFQISGGIVLFLFALDMIFDDSKPEGEMKLLSADHDKTPVFR